MSRTFYLYSAFVIVLVCLEFETKVGRFVPEVGCFPGGGGGGGTPANFG